MKKILLIALVLLTWPVSAAAQGPPTGIGYWRGVTSPTFTGQTTGPVTPTDCSAPQYSFTGDTDTGVGYGGADTLHDCTGGVARGIWSSVGLQAATNMRVRSLTATHPVTDVLPASNFLGLTANSATNLGGSILGISNTDAIGLAIGGIVGSNNGTITTPPIQFVSYVSNGAGVFTVGTGPVLEFVNFPTPYFRVTAAGSAHTFDQNVAGSSTTKVGYLTAIAASLVTPVVALSTTTTGDDPIENLFQNRVTTTDATVTTIQSITIPAATTVGISCTVVNRRTGGVSGTAEDGAYYEITVAMKNVAGTATEIAAETLTVIGESIAGYTVTAVPSGATELIQVTGAATTNITWHSHCRSYPIGS